MGTSLFKKSLLLYRRALFLLWHRNTLQVEVCEEKRQSSCGEASCVWLTKIINSYTDPIKSQNSFLWLRPEAVPRYHTQWQFNHKRTPRWQLGEMQFIRMAHIYLIPWEHRTVCVYILYLLCARRVSEKKRKAKPMLWYTASLWLFFQVVFLAITKEICTGCQWHFKQISANPSRKQAAVYSEVFHHPGTHRTKPDQKQKIKTLFCRTVPCCDELCDLWQHSQKPPSLLPQCGHFQNSAALPSPRYNLGHLAAMFHRDFCSPFTEVKWENTAKCGAVSTWGGGWWEEDVLILLEAKNAWAHGRWGPKGP